MSKWYNLFVSVDSDAPGPEEQSAAKPAGDAAQAVAEIARSLHPAASAQMQAGPAAPGSSPAKFTVQGGPAPTFTTPVNNPTSFNEIYDAAEIKPPLHGFTIQKVGDMLRSEHIRNLPKDVKRSSVLVALEAAGAPIQDVIEDAVKRDRALDGFERVQEKSVNDLEAKTTQDNQQIQAEIDRLVAEHRARIQANSDKLAKEKERFYAWRLKKQEEEQKIADAVSYFVADNPITTGGSAAPPPPGPQSVK
jgi:hypothetical protein